MSVETTACEASAWSPADGVYVVATHHHEDDYKAVESWSDTLGLFKSKRAALIAAIQFTIESNSHSSYLTSETLSAHLIENNKIIAPAGSAVSRFRSHNFRCITLITCSLIY